jgi:hypothetical protein
LQAVAASEDRVCALSQPLFELGFFSLVSRDRGLSFERTGQVLPPFMGTGTTFQAAPCASLAWDPEERAFVGYVRQFDGTEPGPAHLVRSADCTTWSFDEVEDPSAWPVCGYYGVVGGTHELWEVLAEDDVLRRTRLPAPPGGFDPAEPPPRDVSFAFDRGTDPSRRRVLPLAGELILSEIVGGELALSIVDRRTGERSPWTSLAPSRIEGACDAIAIDTPVLYVDPGGRPSGAIAHTCSGTRYEDTSPVLRRFTVEP